MPDASPYAAGLAFLVPLGFALIAVSGLPEDRARHVALSFLAALGLAVVGYVSIGFALEFGGVGLASNRPGLENLIWEWSALGTTWGSGWGMIGLAGWGMAGEAASSGAFSLALANLPWVCTASLIPIIGLRGRIPSWASALLGLLTGAIIFPIANNWIWGGGWLANLGLNLGYGHGYVDPGGAGSVHLLGAAVLMAASLVFLPHRTSHRSHDTQVPLPPIHLPLLAMVGAGLLLVGWLPWIAANPLLPADSLDLSRLALNGFLAAGAGALLPLCYTWFIAGSADPLMSSRGFAAGFVAASATAPFVQPWGALIVGGVAGILTPLAVFVVDHVLRWEDDTAGLAVHGLGGIWGILALGLLADGSVGQGYNGIGSDSFLATAGQGVSGLLTLSGLRPDWPAQLQAQLIGLGAVALFAFFATWIITAPPTLLLRLSARRSAYTANRPSLPMPDVIPDADAEPHTEPFAATSTVSGVAMASVASGPSDGTDDAECGTVPQLDVAGN